jgi:hypothetical protein
LKEDNLKLEQKEKRRKQTVILFSNYLNIGYITLYKESLKQKRSDRSLILFTHVKKENDIAKLKNDISGTKSCKGASQFLFF